MVSDNEIKIIWTDCCSLMERLFNFYLMRRVDRRPLVLCTSDSAVSFMFYKIAVIGRNSRRLVVFIIGRNNRWLIVFIKRTAEPWQFAVIWCTTAVWLFVIVGCTAVVRFLRSRRLFIS